MLSSNKTCDARDWFLPGFQEIITKEFRSSPCFVRKQWEHAALFMALEERGYLDGTKSGIALGAGNEVLLYAVTNRAKHLHVTDLYDDQTVWACARTGSPADFIRENRPFPFDESKMTVQCADMTALEFKDESFDFAYSSCAFEHIGGHDNFIRHLQEVRRVLKPGGLYVFTTEFTVNDEIIYDPNCYVFSPEYIADLLEASGMMYDHDFDASLWEHEINTPLPVNMGNMHGTAKRNVVDHLLGKHPLLQLLRGDIPFTSALFILWKDDYAEKAKRMVFNGLEETRSFLAKGIEQYRSMVEENGVHMYPFTCLPHELSRFYTGHAEFLTPAVEEQTHEALIYHTDYFWFGSGRRIMNVSFRVSSIVTQDCRIQMRIHGYRSTRMDEVYVVKEEDVSIRRLGEYAFRLEFEAEPEYCYASLCFACQGAALYSDIDISCS